jgi:putative DNA primase/helicase
MTPAKQRAQFYYQRATRSALAKVPAELTKYRHWVVWKEAPPDIPISKPKKVPLNPMTLDADDWNNPANWSERSTATQILEENYWLRGVGFVFSNGSNGDPYTFFDLDKSVLNGEIAPWANEFASMVNSYTEISPSGMGIKIIVRAKLGSRRKSFEFTDGKGYKHEIECYDANKFFAATGNRVTETPEIIRDGQSLLDTLHPQTAEEESGPPIDRSDDEYAEEVDAIPDNKLLEKILASKQKRKFEKLMAGSTEDYSGYFSASGALCAILAFWTRANPERINRLYLKSGLYEEKWWEEPCYSGRKSRREYVIEGACRKTAAKEMYVPLPPSPEIKKITDSGNATLLVAAHRDNLLYCFEMKKWLFWDGKRWQVDEKQRARVLMEETLRDRVAELVQSGDAEEITEASAYLDTHRITNGLREAKSSAFLPPI